MFSFKKGKKLGSKMPIVENYLCSALSDPYPQIKKEILLCSTESKTIQKCPLGRW